MSTTSTLKIRYLLAGVLAGGLGGALAALAVTNQDQLRHKSGPLPTISPQLDPILTQLIAAVEGLNLAVEESKALAPVVPRRVVSDGSKDDVDSRANEMTESLLSAAQALRETIALASGVPTVEPLIDTSQLQTVPINDHDFEALASRSPSVLGSSPELPLELAVLGLPEIIERFGWPDAVKCPSNPGELFRLEYDESLTSSVIGAVEIRCDLKQTFRIEMEPVR